MMDNTPEDNTREPAFPAPATVVERLLAGSEMVARRLQQTHDRVISTILAAAGDDDLDLDLLRGALTADIEELLVLDVQLQLIDRARDELHNRQLREGSDVAP